MMVVFTITETNYLMVSLFYAAPVVIIFAELNSLAGLFSLFPA